MYSHFYPALPTTNFKNTLRSQVEIFKNRINVIPRIITAIWVGKDVPDTAEQPYLTYLVKHKRFNPDAKVQLLVCKKLLAEHWESLVARCAADTIILRDIEETCASYINFDIIKKFLEGDEKDFVWLSDLLRLSVMYHEGGYYFDTDLEPIAAIEEIPAVYGFLQAFDQDSTKPEIFYCFQASVPEHPFYLYQATVSRHFYECYNLVLNQPDAIEKHTWLNTSFAQIRLRMISSLSGSPYPSMHYGTSLFNFFPELYLHANYPLSNNCVMRFDNTWLKPFSLANPEDWAEYKYQCDDFVRFHIHAMKGIRGDVLLRLKLADYFPEIYNAACYLEQDSVYHPSNRYSPF